MDGTGGILGVCQLCFPFRKHPAAATGIKAVEDIGICGRIIHLTRLSTEGWTSGKTVL